MKKIILSLIIVVIIIGLAYIFKDIVAVESKADDDRFIKISRQDYFIFYYDKATKVQYVVSDGRYNRGSATVLVDQDGKPLLYKEAE